MQMSHGSSNHPVGTVYGVLFNDIDTLARLAPEFAAPPYGQAPEAPILYVKPRNTHVGEGATVAVPVDPGVVRIDATVGVVIGRPATRIHASEALQHVAGYVIVSDVTLPHDDYYRPAIAQRCRDGFCPIGKFHDAHTAHANGFNPACADVRTAVNGVEVHRWSLARLVRSLPQLLTDVSEFMTLSENDVLLLGAPDAAALARPGDAVTIGVDGLGQLHHTLILETLP